MEQSILTNSSAGISIASNNDFFVIDEVLCPVALRSRQRSSKLEHEIWGKVSVTTLEAQ